MTSEESTVLRIPNATLCDNRLIIAIWTINNQNCQCSLIKEGHHPFEDCIQTNNCASGYEVTLEDGDMIFHNLTSVEDFLLHFVCDERRYDEGFNFVRIVIESHLIKNCKLATPSALSCHFLAQGTVRVTFQMICVACPFRSGKAFTHFIRYFRFYIYFYDTN